MSNQFLKLRRSAVPGRIPTTSSLDFGEIALNTYDGLAFMKKSGSSGEEIVTLGTGAGGGNMTGSQYFIPIFNSTSSLITSSIYQSGSFTGIRATASVSLTNPDILFVSGDGINTYNLISAHGNLNSYVQVNVQNYNTGGFASSDIVATSDNGNESTNYIDMGINGSNYASPDFVGGAGDAYMYSTGNDLYIGNASTGKQIILFNGGLDAINNARIFIHDQGTISINTDQFNTVNPPSLVVYAPNSLTNTLIQGVGQTDQFLQLAMANTNAGQDASADIVAYNDLDPSNQGFGFIDMGINSSGFSDPINYPGWAAGESYVYTDAPGMIIGNASGSSQINMFVGGINPVENSKLILRANNTHSLTGSLQVTGSVTGSNDFLINGITVGRGSGNVSTNVVIGTSAASVNDTGKDSVIIGYEAGKNLIAYMPGNYADSVLIGFQAGYSQTTVYDTVAIGWKAGFANVTGKANTYLGTSAGLQQAEGNYNVFVGSISGVDFRSGSQNTIVGYNTFRSVASGSYNTVLGSRITGLPTTVNNNIIIADGQGNIKYRWDNIQNNIYGNLAVTGSVTATTGFTGSLFGTASWAQNSITASYIITSISASYAATASTAISASFASTASSADNFLVRGTLTAQTIVAQTITSSTDFVTGSTRFGSLLSNTHQFTGSVSITGSLAVNGSNVISTNQTGSMSVATASFATSSLSASFASTASIATSASFASTASYVLNAVSASYAVTASYISASGIAGLSLSQITLGAVTASVNAGNNLFNIISGSNTLVVVNNTGSMGIGTTSPAYKLDVFGPVRLYPRGAINGGFEFTFSDVYNIMNANSHTYLSSNYTLMVGAGNGMYTFIGVNKDDYITPVLIGYNSWQSNLSSPSAILDIKSTTKGFLPPRMTAAQRTAISSPARGLLVYDIDSTTEGLWFYNSGSAPGWQEVLTNTGSQSILGGLTATSFTGSLFGTASWATNALTASFISTASLVGNFFAQGGNSFGTTALLGTNDNQPVVIETNGSEKLRILSNGNVGINQTSPSYRLDVKGQARVGTSTSQTHLFVGDTTDAAYSANQAILAIDSTQNSELAFRTNGSTVFFLRSFETSAFRFYTGDGTIVANWSIANKNVVFSNTSIASGPDASSVVEFRSTNRGFLLPRTDLTSNISSPVQGLTTYITSSATEGLYYYSGTTTSWHKVLSNSGSQSILGGLTATSFSGSLFGTASWANNAVTASYVLNAISASYAATASIATSASFATTSSYVLNAVSASFASTASSADNFLVRGTLTAQTIVAQTITSSTDFVTGSTRFGSLLSNTHQFTGSVSITGSLTLPYLSAGSVLFTGATDEITEDNTNFFWDNINKRLGIGTNTPSVKLHVSGTNELLKFGDGGSGTDAFMSFNDRGYLGFKGNGGGLNFIANTTRPIIFGIGANFNSFTEVARFSTSNGNLLLQTTNSLNDNGYKVQISQINTSSGSLWVSGSSVMSGSLNVTQGITGSLFGTSSWSQNAVTSSYILNAVSASFATTASYVLNAVSSSFAATASYANSVFDIGIAEFNSTSSTTTAGTTAISSINTGSFTSAFYNYTISSGSNARAGQVMSVWSGTTVRYTEVTTTDIGNTATASFAVAISGPNVRLNFTAPGVWTVKSIANLL